MRELERQRGQQDARWVHLLGEVDTGPGEGAAPAEAEDRDRVLADGAEARDARVRATYDAVAEDYAEALTDELDHLPLERWLLERVVGLAGYLPVVEVGSGPGHVTAHLAALGAEAHGLDLSPAMVEQARARYPEVSYEVGDLRRLVRPTSASGWGAVLAWYSLIHLAASELPGAVEALARPLAPGGVLVLALHAGTDVRHVDEWFGHPVDLDVVRHEPGELLGPLAAAGLADVEWYRRGPITRTRRDHRAALRPRAPSRLGPHGPGSPTHRSGLGAGDERGQHPARLGVAAQRLARGRAVGGDGVLDDEGRDLARAHGPLEPGRVQVHQRQPGGADTADGQQQLAAAGPGARDQAAVRRAQVRDVEPVTGGGLGEPAAHQQRPHGVVGQRTGVPTVVAPPGHRHGRQAGAPAGRGRHGWPSAGRAAVRRSR